MTAPFATDSDRDDPLRRVRDWAIITGLAIVAVLLTLTLTRANTLDTDINTFLKDNRAYLDNHTKTQRLVCGLYAPTARPAECPTR